MTSLGHAGSPLLCAQCGAFFPLIFADDIESFCINSLMKRLIIKAITGQGAAAVTWLRHCGQECVRTSAGVCVLCCRHEAVASASSLLASCVLKANVVFICDIMPFPVYYEKWQLNVLLVLINHRSFCKI